MLIVFIVLGSGSREEPAKACVVVRIVAVPCYRLSFRALLTAEALVDFNHV